MQWLRSIAFVLVFYSVTVLLVLVGLVLALLGRDAMRSLVRFWTGLYDMLCRYVLGIRPDVQGTLPAGAHLIAVKHESMYETMQVARMANTPAIVLKRELSQIPLFGWLTRRYGVIPVDRSAGAKALRDMMQKGRDFAAQGRSVIIYPEGTRVPPGTRPPLRPGFAGLYRTLGLPVVPVAIDSGRLWTKGLIKRPGTIHIRIGDTIPPGLNREEIERRVHVAINALQP